MLFSSRSRNISKTIVGHKSNRNSMPRPFSNFLEGMGIFKISYTIRLGAAMGPKESNKAGP